MRNYANKTAGQGLIQEQAPGSGRPSLPDHEAEQPDCPVPRPSGLLTAARLHRSGREQETLSSCVWARAQEVWATCAGNRWALLRMEAVSWHDGSHGQAVLAHTPGGPLTHVRVVCT